MIIKQTIGVTITFTVKLDGTPRNISTATVKQLKVLTPAGVLKTFTAAFVGGGTTGQISYTTLATTDLPEAGTYQICAYIEMPGWSGHTSTDSFDISDTLV